MCSVFFALFFNFQQWKEIWVQNTGLWMLALDIAPPIARQACAWTLVRTSWPAG